MEKEFSTIGSGESTLKAAKMISRSEQGFLIVTDGGKPKGIVTDNDLVSKVMAKGMDPTDTSVKEVMTSPIISVDPDDDLLKASEKMQEKGIRRLAVVRDDIIYGVISTRDIAQRCGEYVQRSVRDIMRWSFPLEL